MSDSYVVLRDYFVDLSRLCFIPVLDQWFITLKIGNGTINMVDSEFLVEPSLQENKKNT